MGITRRQFLRWSGASAVGAVVFNGCQIPEQELQVESPVDLPEDLVSGVDNWYATICRQDPEGCGIIVRVVEGRAKKIEGNPDYPVNQGKHSGRSEAGLQALYHPDRLQEPLFRESVSGEFSPISWSDARAKIVDRLRNLPDKSRFVLMTQPLRGHLALVANDFVEAIGGKHMAFETLDQANLRGAVSKVFGSDRGIPEFDIENAKYLISFGADFLSTWLSPVKYSRGYGEFRQGHSKRGVHVQVDSRFSMTAANADEWIPVKPGGEGILAMSMIYTIIKDGLGDADIADKLTQGSGYEGLNDFRPDSSDVFNATGVSSERITHIAHEFADPHNRPSIAIGGGSAGAHTSGLFNLSAIYSLNLLVGNIGKPGGLFFKPLSPIDDLNKPGVVEAGIPTPFLGWKEMDRPEMVMLRGVNPVHSLPAGSNFVSSLQAADFVVSFSSFMDETTSMANLIMPENTYLEDWGDDTPDPGPRYQLVGLQQPIVRPFYSGTGSFADELLAIGTELELGSAQRLGLDGGSTPKFEDLLKASARKLWEMDRGSVRAATFEGFWNGILQRGGWWDLDSIDNDTELEPGILDSRWPDVAIDGPSGDDTYNLIPFLSNSMSDGNLAHLPWLQALPDPVTSVVWDTWIEINTKIADEKGIVEGDVMEVTSDAGTIEAPAYIHPAVPPWTVSMPIGQGHTAFGRYAEGVGANTLSLLPTTVDNTTGGLAWAATRVRVSKTGRRVDLATFSGNVPAFEPDKGRIIKVTPPESHGH